MRQTWLVEQTFRDLTHFFSKPTINQKYLKNSRTCSQHAELCKVILSSKNARKNDRCIVPTFQAFEQKRYQRLLHRLKWNHIHQHRPTQRLRLVHQRPSIHSRFGTTWTHLSKAESNSSVDVEQSRGKCGQQAKEIAPCFPIKDKIIIKKKK